ncbi:MAG: cyclophilin-like fold protein [Sedimenticolaceae bacterium]
MQRIRISWPAGEVSGHLEDTPTARKLLAALPYEASASTWGDEVYFRLPFSAEPEPNATSVVKKGAICFWLDGSSLALLFGPTPVSRGDECRLVSDANVLGMIDGDPTVLRSVRDGDSVQVESM